MTIPILFIPSFYIASIIGVLVCQYKNPNQYQKVKTTLEESVEFEL